MKKFEISKRLMWFFALLLPAVMAGCADSNGGPTSAPPSVTATFPARAVTTAPTNTSITATFSEAMDPTTIDSTTFTLRVFNTTGVTDLITGTVTLDPASNIATFDPADDLQPSTAYSATITTGVKSLASGKAMEAEYNWSFTTGLAADNTAPAVISTSEYGTTGLKSGLTGLPINRASTATFNKTMNSATISSPATNFTVEEVVSGANVAGTVTYSGTTATFTPTGNLLPNTEYISTIKVGAKDLAGISIAVPYIWSWKTAATEDNASPTLTLTNPANLATNVPIDKKITATFSEPMKQSTIITTNFTVNEKLTPFTNVPGTVSYDVQNDIATFSPQDNLKLDTEYTVLVTSGAKDLAGNALIVRVETPNAWTFKTAAVPVAPAPPLAINLGSAAKFGIASRAGLTSTGVTVVTGDVALSPTATCIDSTGNAGASQTCLQKTYASATGMTVNGSIYFASDPFDNGVTAASVSTALNLAWVEGRAKAPTKGTVAGDQLSSVDPYAPGVYHNANLNFAANGTATLAGGANDVWIFQVDSDFVDYGTALLPTRIILTGQAQARNVWFVAGRDITIGSGTIWNGNILAGRDATVNAGSQVLGRVLAGASGAGAFVLTGAATPDTTITVPE